MKLNIYDNILCLLQDFSGGNIDLQVKFKQNTVQKNKAFYFLIWNVNQKWAFVLVNHRKVTVLDACNRHAEITCNNALKIAQLITDISNLQMNHSFFSILKD